MFSKTVQTPSPDRDESDFNVHQDPVRRSFTRFHCPSSFYAIKHLQSGTNHNSSAGCKIPGQEFYDLQKSYFHKCILYWTMPSLPTRTHLGLVESRILITWSSTAQPKIMSNGNPYHHTSCDSGVSLESKGRIEAFTTGSPHTNTIVITAEIESGFFAKDYLVPFSCSPTSSCMTPLQMEALMGGCQGKHT
ncbi:hypothetical protein TNCV_2308971 [Trichonephila clavipes]|nr:hypothetical protein TNCV_2308971 [Trichonephila clavipes]